MEMCGYNEDRFGSVAEKGKGTMATGGLVKRALKDMVEVFMRGMEQQG